MNTELLNIKELKENLHIFAKERNWQKFHSPKNISMALSVECAELLEHFQWATEEESKNFDKETLTKVGEEVADVLIYLVRLSDQLGIDIPSAVEDKLKKNALKYPAPRE